MISTPMLKHKRNNPGKCRKLKESNLQMATLVKKIKAKMAEVITKELKSLHAKAQPIKNKTQTHREVRK